MENSDTPAETEAGSNNGQLRSPAETELEIGASEHEAAEPAAMEPPEQDEIEYPESRPTLASINNSQQHRLMLREWKREAKFLERECDRKASSFRRSWADLVTILGLDFAFQGLLISGIAPRQIVVCRHFPFVCLLSVIASVGAFCATVLKLRVLADSLLDLNGRIKQRNWQNGRITELKHAGADFDFGHIQPFNLGVQEISGEGPLQRCAAQAALILGFWALWSRHSGAILFLLITFSVAIVVFIKLMLCG